jgi:biopolymer transport protein ExbD
MSFGTLDSGNQTAPMAEINTTPLVDVMLVLLVIFIITAPLFQQAIPIDLPKASANKLDLKPEVVQVAIDANSAIFINNKPIERSALKSTMEQLAKDAITKGVPELHLRADKNSRYEIIAEIMASAQQAGLSKIGFVTDAPKKP